MEYSTHMEDISRIRHKTGLCNKDMGKEVSLDTGSSNELEPWCRGASGLMWKENM